MAFGESGELEAVEGVESSDPQPARTETVHTTSDKMRTRTLNDLIGGLTWGRHE